MSSCRLGARARTIGSWLLMLAAASGATTVPALAASADEQRPSREAQRAAAEVCRAEQQARREAANAQRRQQIEARESAREERAATCQRIVAWLAVDVAEAVPPEVLGARFGGGRPGAAAGAIPYESWLLQDARFVPTFGKRYDEVPVAEQQRLRDAGNNCPSPRNARNQAIADNMLFYRAFSEPYRTRYVQGVSKIRQAHAQVDAAMKDLQDLSRDEDGAKRFREHAARRGELAVLLAGGRRMTYRQAFADAYRQALVPWHTERLQQAAAGAQGYEGLAVLAELQGQMQRDANAAGGGASVPPEVRAKQTELAQALVVQERVRIDALGSGPSGLARGVLWHEEARRRYGRLDVAQAELNAMFAYFEMRRGAMLDDAQPELTRLIKDAHDESELQQLVARHIPLEMDRSRPSGTALIQQLALQRDELHKRSILGSGAMAATPTGGAGALVPTAAGTGEPTESDMYDALNAGLKAANDEARQTAERCNRGEYKHGQGDSVLALQCLQFGLGVGVTQDGQNVAPPRFTVSSFKKIACEKAQGQAGYVCDYIVGMAGNLNLPPSMTGPVKAGQMAQGRFVRQDTGWLLIPSQR